MQKVVNAMAVFSFAVSLGVVAAGVTLYCLKDDVSDAVVENVKQQVVEMIGNMDVEGLLPDGEIPVQPFSVPEI